MCSTSTAAQRGMLLHHVALRRRSVRTCTMTCPESGSSSPAMRRRVVDLPVPEPPADDVTMSGVTAVSNLASASTCGKERYTAMCNTSGSLLCKAKRLIIH